MRIIDAADAAHHRRRLEEAEAVYGPLHYKAKVHTILRSPLELAIHKPVLDIVEALIGPNILFWNSTYIIKEPRNPSHVSWHQDLTYWGLGGDDQVSMWLALSPANEANGCMRLVPGSHRAGRRDHRIADSETNLLFQGQTVEGVDESQAVYCPLLPGEASFHRGWTVHSSPPNRSDERRIGLNVQYLAAHICQTKHDRDPEGADELLRWVDREADAAVRWEPWNWRMEHLLAQFYRVVADTRPDYEARASSHLTRARALAPARELFPAPLAPPGDLAGAPLPDGRVELRWPATPGAGYHQIDQIAQAAESGVWRTIRYAYGPAPGTLAVPGGGFRYRIKVCRYPRDCSPWAEWP